MLIIFLVLVKPSSVARETELWPGPARGISELSSCLGPPGHHYPLNINLNPLEHMFYHFLDLRERFVLKILSLIILLVIYTVTTFIKVHCFLCVAALFFFFCEIKEWIMEVVYCISQCPTCTTTVQNCRYATDWRITKSSLWVIFTSLSVPWVVLILYTIQNGMQTMEARASSQPMA